MQLLSSHKYLKFDSLNFGDLGEFGLSFILRKMIHLFNIIGQNSELHTTKSSLASLNREESIQGY